MTTMKKPLYLDAKAPLEVRLLGPALSVERAGCAPRWYPFARLSRVVSRGPVHWQGDALCACMQAAVTVLFLDASGRPAGLCTGSLRRVANLEEHLETALSAPDGLDRFANWQRSQERRLIQQLIRTLGWAQASSPGPDLARRLQHALAARHGPDSTIRLGWYLSLLAGHSHHTLVDAGISPARISGDIGGLNLGQRITQLAAWTLRGCVLCQHRPLPRGLDQAARSYADLLEAPMTRCLDRLVHNLWQIAV